MKIPETFLPEKKLDNKIEELLKEKRLKKSQLDGYEIPKHAIQENGDYLVMTGGIIINMPRCKSITCSTFYFTIKGEEHKLHIGNEEVITLDEKFVSIKESLISKLFQLGLAASQEQGHLVVDGSDWSFEMKYITEEAYKELSNSLKNGGIKPIIY